MREVTCVRSPSLQNLAGNEVCSIGPGSNRRFRIVLLGPSGVGKTSLVQRLLDRPCPLKHRPTVEEMHELELTLNGIKIALEVLDTSGTYEFPAMRRLAFDKGDAFLLMFSMDDAESFEGIRAIRQELKERRGAQVPVLVVANKSDLIPEQSGTINETVVRMDWEYPYLECSAMKDKEVTPAFSQLLFDLVRLEEAIHTPETEQPRQSLKKKFTRGISLPQGNILNIKPKSKVPLIKRHSCVVS